MGWLYVPGLGGSNFRSGSHLVPATPLSATWNANFIALKSWSRVWKTALSTTRLSGTLLNPLMAIHFVGQWTLSLRDCRASRIRSPVRSLGTMTNVLSGPTSFASSKRSDRRLSSLKTSSAFSESSDPFIADFDTWVLSSRLPASTPRPSVAHRTSDEDSSSLPLTQIEFPISTLPTPTENMHTGPWSDGRDGGLNLQTAVDRLPTPTARDYKDGACQDANVPSNNLLGRVVARLPTPIAGDGTKDPTNSLSRLVRKMPTPTSNDSRSSGSRNTEGSKAHMGVSLTDYVQRGGSSETGSPVEGSGHLGQLNPRFSEWLLGWPVGHASLEPLEAGLFQRWLDAHSLNFLKR